MVLEKNCFRVDCVGADWGLNCLSGFYIRTQVKSGSISNIEIDTFQRGKDNHVFIIAELSANHYGSLENSLVPMQSNCKPTLPTPLLPIVKIILRLFTQLFGVSIIYMIFTKSHIVRGNGINNSIRQQMKKD